MFFLSAKLALLMLGSALLGGLCAWWLARRHFERRFELHLADGAAEHQRLQAEWVQWRQQVDRRLAAPADPDWTPLLQRLGAVEKALHGIRLPTPEPTNLRPVIDAVASMRVPSTAAVDLQPMMTGLMELQRAVATLRMPPAG